MSDKFIEVNYKKNKNVQSIEQQVCLYLKGLLPEDQVTPDIKYYNNETLLFSKRGSKPCRYAIKKNGEFGVCRNPNCTYAHTKSELKIKRCRNGENCTRENCYYIHNDSEVPELPETKVFSKSFLRSSGKWIKSPQINQVVTANIKDIEQIKIE